MAKFNHAPLHLPLHLLILIRGASGSGKSTYAKTHFPDHLLIEADDYFGTLSTKLPEAHAQCLARTSNVPVVVANTFTQIHHLAPYLALRPTQPRILHITRLHPNTHGVPHHAVIRQLCQMEPFQNEELIA